MQGTQGAILTRARAKKNITQEMATFIAISPAFQLSVESEIAGCSFYSTAGFTF